MQQDNEEKMVRQCPYCFEEIHEQAVKCKHCGSMLNDTIGGMATIAPDGGGVPSKPGTTPGTGGGTDWGDTLDGMATYAPESLTAGQVLAGRYRLDSIIGSGGMGVVWRATDSELDMTVAVKVLPGVLTRNKRAIASLKAEAALSLKLTHSNVCRLHTFHADGNVKFLVMEYLEGRTLEAMLDDRPDRKIPLAELRPIAKHIGEALDYAHSLSPPVLHRDIKPANIMIAPDGSAKLLDFGIAREIKDTMTQVTGKFDTAGTLPYMSPEQFRGSKMTTASDVYSFAAVLYECIAGKPYISPSGDPSYQILQRPYESIDDAPDEINAALKAALAKDHSQRTAKCSGILQVLPVKAAPSCVTSEGVDTSLPKSPVAVSSPRVPVTEPRRSSRSKRPLKEEILDVIANLPGLTDREIATHLRGQDAPQQPVNQACRQLEAAGELQRSPRKPDQLIGNYLPRKKMGSIPRPRKRIQRWQITLGLLTVPGVLIWLWWPSSIYRPIIQGLLAVTGVLIWLRWLSSIDRQMDVAREAIAKGAWAKASLAAENVLKMDPGHAEAQELKRHADSVAPCAPPRELGMPQPTRMRKK